MTAIAQRTADDERAFFNKVVDLAKAEGREKGIAWVDLISEVIANGLSTVLAADDELLFPAIMQKAQTQAEAIMRNRAERTAAAERASTIILSGN